MTVVFEYDRVLRVVGVWIGGVWNGYFPESEKYFSEAEISREIPEIPQKEAIFAKFQAPKFENSEPEKMQFHTPTRLPRIKVLTKET